MNTNCNRVLESATIHPQIRIEKASKRLRILHGTLLACLLVLLSFPQFSYSQSDVDVIYTKKGSKIKGRILEQVPGKYIKLRSSDGDDIVIDEENIDRIEKEGEGVREEYSRRGDHSGYYFMPNGFINSTAYTSESDLTTIKSQGVGLELNANFLYMFSRHWGIFTGINIFSPMFDQKMYAFVGAPLGFRLLTGKPHRVNLYLDMGASVGVNPSYEGRRVLVNWFDFGIGLKIPATRDVSFTVGYKSSVGGLYSPGNASNTPGFQSYTTRGMSVGLLYKFAEKQRR